MRKINLIIIHCTATIEGRDYTVSTIDSWHRQRGFDCIGYHYVVYRDGTVHEGRPVAKVGAHCAGHNANSIGVCYIGGVDDKQQPKDTRTPAQRNALVNLLMRLKRQYPAAVIRGHRDFSTKACPSFDATSEYADISKM